MGDSTSHRTHLKLGALDFSAEGSEDSVRAQWDQLVALLGNEQVMALVAAKAASPAAPSKEQHQPDDDAKEETGESAGVTDTTKERPPVQLAHVAPEVIRRVFLDDQGRGVSLRILPRGKDQAVDALVLLLYGFRALRGQQDVRATDLTAALRVSGIKVDRIDRVLEKRASLVTSGGRAKGKVYGLNNQGVNAAVVILTGMV